MTVFRLLSAAATAALVAAPALAGGYAEPAPIPVVPAPIPVPPPAPSADWSGFYIGGQIATGRLTFSNDAFDVEDTYSDLIGGLHAGYLADLGRFVVGAEAAFDWSRIDDSEDFPEDPLALDSVARIGVRAGFDAGRVLPYASAGLSRATFSWDGGDGSTDGFFFGGGVEFAVSDRLSVGAEVLRHEWADYAEDIGTEDPNWEAGLTTLGLRGSFRF